MAKFLNEVNKIIYEDLGFWIKVKSNTNFAVGVA